MLLQSALSLAEPPGLPAEQWERLRGSVEHKKQQLQHDINAFVRCKQDELRQYEQELVEQCRSRERAPKQSSEGPDSTTLGARPESESAPASAETASTPVHPPSASTSNADSKTLGPEEKAKRTKHTRVHKREKELCGLVTPLFLPLLDAGEGALVPRKKDKRRRKGENGEEAGITSPPASEQGSPPRDAEKGKEKRRSRSKNRDEKMEHAEEATGGEPSREHKADSGKKSRRSSIKKSSLRHDKTPRSRRKRVSLVIDDQIVRPADSVPDPPLTSPSETTASSVSNSTTSPDDAIDPRLISRQDTPVRHEHQDAVHHNVPLPMPLPSASPTKHVGHTISESPPNLRAGGSQSENLSPRKTAHEPPPSAARTFLDPSPPEESLVIPQHAGSDPIHANEFDVQAETEEKELEFSTYVGGLSGSNVDDVDQAGSYGYPSSLGASYLESYMQSRPLSVRMAATEQAEGKGKGKQKEQLDPRTRRGIEDDMDVDVRRMHDDDDDMDVMGGMEGF